MTNDTSHRRTRLDRAYNAFLEHAALPFGDTVLRTEFMRELRRWRLIQHLDSASLRQMERDGLAKLLAHASREVAHYRELGIQASEDPYEWLRRFPILTKADLRSEGERLITPGSGKLVKVVSSGSSGFQSTLWSTPAEISRAQAIQTLWWEWAGYRIGDPLLQTGMTPDRGVVKRVKDRMLRTSYVTAFGLTRSDMLEVLDGYGKRKWRHIGGYASSIDALARVALEEGRTIRFESAISWGDKLYPAHRRHLADAFDAPVVDTYGATEGFMIAAQRFDGPYYVMSPHVVVELLDDHDEPVPPGQMGRVVVTRIDALAMPIIRFALGDLAVAPARPEASPHGLEFPQLERVVGRETDVWISPGGRTITVHTFTGVFEHEPEIEQFSVIPSDDSLVIEYRSSTEVPPGVLERASARLREAVGESLELAWVRVDTIPDSPSGKPQIIRRPLRD